MTVRRGRDSECVDDPNSGCVEEVDAARASAALIITVDPAGPARDVPIVSLNLLYGERQLTLTEQIPEGDSEARTLYQTLAAQALGRWGSAELTTLTVGGSPEGAAVQIGRLLGQLPFTARVQPGPHELIVRAPGFETHHETIQVPSQPEYALSIHLEPEGDANGNSNEESDENDDAPRDWRRIAGPVMVGAGVLGAAGVIVASVLRTGCQEEDALGCREDRELNLGPTLGYAGIGAAVAITGAILWITASGSRTAVSVGPSDVHVRIRF